MEPSQVKQSMLFHGMEEAEIREALQRLQAREKRFGKGEVLLRAGEVTDQLGLVAEGSVTIESNDAAESYAMLDHEPLLVDVTANEDCRILFLRNCGVQTLTVLREAWAMKVVANLLTISAHKNLTLSGRSFHTAPKTIRGRVMSYLNSVSLQTHARAFDIPFDRQQLADYLNVERSALSKELGKMERDGLIECRKNHFTILLSDPD